MQTETEALITQVRKVVTALSASEREALVYRKHGGASGFGSALHKRAFAATHVQIAAMKLQLAALLGALAIAPQRLTCCCCGEAAGGRQWALQTPGYGLCRDCVKRAEQWQEDDARYPEYGVRGVHYDIAVSGTAPDVDESVGGPTPSRQVDADRYRQAVGVLRKALVAAEAAIKGREHTGFIDRALADTADLDQPVRGAIDATSAVASGDESGMLLDWTARVGIENLKSFHLMDHACRQCVGDGPLVRDGFQCVPHLAAERVTAQLTEQERRDFFRFRAARHNNVHSPLGIPDWTMARLVRAGLVRNDGTGRYEPTRLGEWLSEPPALADEYSSLTDRSKREVSAAVLEVWQENAAANSRQ